MLTMDQVEHIILLHKIEGLSLREISRITGRHFNTVKKIVDRKDWNEVRKERKTRISNIDTAREIIDEWLKKDLEAPRNQRHTGKHVYDRLKKSHPDILRVKKRTVQSYVSKKKKELCKSLSDCALHLEHPPFEAQVDFGQFVYHNKDGVLSKGYGLVMSFPRSNGGYMQVFRGENQECLLQGMKNIFEYLGKVPTRAVFDNLSAAVANIGRSGDRKLVDQFKRFCLHYGVEPVFCNPAAPQEKGNVEVKVGYGRRNWLVPVPDITDFPSFNRNLLTLCDEDMTESIHYLKEQKIITLLAEDVKTMACLPVKAFEVERMLTILTDSQSFAKVDSNRYSTSPKFVQAEVEVRLTAEEIRVYDMQDRLITVHKREYGKKCSPIQNWTNYIEAITRKPRAIKYTSFFRQQPKEWQEYFDVACPQDAGKMLTVFRSNFENGTINLVTDALLAASKQGKSTVDDTLALYRKMNQNTFYCINKVPAGLPVQAEYLQDFSMYGRLMEGGECYE